MSTRTEKKTFARGRLAMGSIIATAFAFALAMGASSLAWADTQDANLVNALQTPATESNLPNDIDDSIGDSIQNEPDSTPQFETIDSENPLGGSFNYMDDVQAGVEPVAPKGEEGVVTGGASIPSSEPSKGASYITASNVEDEDDYVAEINGNKYASFAEAIQNVSENEMIKLLKDVEESVVIAEGVSFNIDLNGKTISYAADHTIVNRGFIRILDLSDDGTGKIANTGNKGVLVNYPTGKVEIYGGIFEKIGRWYAIKNLGEMIIVNGTFTTTDAGSSMIANGWYGSAGNDLGLTGSNEASLMIGGGTFSGGMNSVKNDDYGKLLIANGSFSNTTGPVILNWNEATINGGTFTSSAAGKTVIANGALNGTADKGLLTINGGTFNAVDPCSLIFGYGGGTVAGMGTLAITGGTFNGLVSVNEAVSYDVQISGGVFANELQESYLAEGFAALPLNGDRYAVADVNDVPASLNSALNYKNNFNNKFHDEGGMTWDYLITSMYFLQTARADVAALADGSLKAFCEDQLEQIRAFYASIESLDMSGKNTSKFAISTGALIEFTGLKSLNLSGTGITEVGGLVYLTQLEELDLSDNPALDDGLFGALVGMNGLRSINLAGTGIADFGGLVGAGVSDTLEYLDISGTQVTKIQSLWMGENKFPVLATLVANDLELDSISGVVEVINDNENPLVAVDMAGSTLMHAKVNAEHIDMIRKKLGSAFVAPAFQHGSFDWNADDEWACVECGYVSENVSEAIGVAYAPSAHTSLKYNGMQQDLVLIGTPEAGSTIMYAIGDANHVTGAWSTQVPQAANVGAYYVWYMATGTAGYYHYYAESPIEVTIGKGAPSANVNVFSNLVYNGSEQELVESAIFNGSEIFYALGDSTDIAPTEWSTQIPVGVNAGSYVIWFKVVGNEFYENSGAMHKTVTIAKAPIESVIAPAAVNFVFDGTYRELLNAGSAVGGIMKYGFGGSSSKPSYWTDELPVASNVGTYYVWYKVEGDENHYDYVGSRPIAVTISKGEVVVTAPQASNLTYTGELQDLVIAGSVNDGTIEYALGVDGTTAPETGWSAVIPQASEVGTYYIWYKGVAGMNSGYENTQPAFVTVAIVMGDAQFVAPVANGPIFNGSIQALVTAGSSTTGTMEYAFGTATDAPINGWSTAVPVAIDAGTYYIWYRVVGDEHFAGIDPVCMTAVMSKAYLTVAAPTAVSTTYNGSAQGLAYAGSANGGTILYALGTDATTAPIGGWNTVIPVGTNAGTYYVWYRFVGDDNHYDTAPNAMIATIAKASATVTAPIAATLTYNGAAQALISAGSANGGTIEYALGTSATNAPASGWGTALPVATNAGTYYVWYRVVGDDNHNGIVAASVLVSIAEPPATEDPENPENGEGNDTPETPETPVVPEIPATPETPVAPEAPVTPAAPQPAAPAAAATTTVAVATAAGAPAVTIADDATPLAAAADAAVPAADATATVIDDDANPLASGTELKVDKQDGTPLLIAGMILAVVIAGGFLLLLSRRRKDDDEQ